MFTGLVMFSVSVLIIDFFILKGFEKLEKAELASYLALTAWGSLFWGLLLSR